MYTDLLHVTDDYQNILFTIEHKSGFINAKQLSTKIIEGIFDELLSIKTSLNMAKKELEDLKEAHEHTDDSLANLRLRVDNHIHGGTNGIK